jgi:4-amino-4-deoxy-L-arabinose transferase-like glycosyltransferase
MSDPEPPTALDSKPSSEGAVPASRRTWIILLLILLGSTGLKLSLVDDVKNQVRVGDQKQYLTGSRNVYRKGITEYSFEQWDEAHSSPLYPYALGYLRYVVHAKNYRGWVISIQAVISTLTALLTFIIARRCFGPRNALLSAGLVAFLPSFISYSQLFLTETLYTFLFLAVTAVLVTAKDSVSRRRAFAAGLVGGLTALTKSQFMVLSPLVVLWLLVQGSEHKKAAALSACAYVFGLLLVVAPWSVRNTLRYDHFLMIDTNPGNVLHKNWNAFPPENHDVGLFGKWEENKAEYNGEIPARPRSTEENIAARNSAEVKAAIGFILAHPMHFLGQCWTRTQALFNPTSFLIRRIREGKSLEMPRVWQEGIVWVTILSLGGILVFSVIGMTTVRPNPQSLLPLMLLLGCTVLCVAILSTSRYRFPMLPFLIMFAVDGGRRVPALVKNPSPGLVLTIPILLIAFFAFYRYGPLSL